MNMCKKKNPCIKHKLWGKLKEEAKSEFKIFPVEGDDLWTVRYRSEGFGYVEYNDCDDYENLDDAIEFAEAMRRSHFHRICEKALFERKCKRVANL